MYRLSILQVFDLVDADRLAPDRGSFRVRKSMYFSEFKHLVGGGWAMPLQRHTQWQNSDYKAWVLFYPVAVGG
jgi:hypothetical protein